MSSGSSSMQELLIKEPLVHSSPPIVRQAPGSNTTMRKYQQLTLAIVAVVSFVACIFYKHEYERLRYTLQYLDTFGEPPPVDANQEQQCVFLAQMRASTAPAEWTTVTHDVAVYSSFWDDNGGILDSKLRTIALVEKTSETPSELGVKLWYDSGQSSLASCEMEKAEARSHVAGSSKVFHIVYLLCVPNLPKELSYLKDKAPTLVQFSKGNGEWTEFKAIHESDSYKSVADKSAVCVVPTRKPMQSVHVVEFISHYQNLGFQKFIFYGNGLTPTTRNLLNKFMDEIGIMVEEKSFNYIPSLQTLENNTSNKGNLAVLEYLVQHIIELDCQYRHRDAFENIVVLRSDEFIIPNTKKPLMDTIKALFVDGGPGAGRPVAELHLSTQYVCVDKEHSIPGMPSELLLGQQTRTNGGLELAGVAVLRPHLTTSIGSTRLAVQHVPPAAAVVYRYGECAAQDHHADTLHLPTKPNFVRLIQQSLLYRKWKVLLM